MRGFHVLWEVESWTPEPPRDPALLRHLRGDLWSVLAVWDLTELAARRAHPAVMSFADPDSATVAGPTPPPTVMRGPTHADNYRIKVGRYKDRWYRDPLPADDTWNGTPDTESYPSVSIVKGASGKDWTYTSLKRIAHADDLAELAGKGFYERYERFKVINQLDLSAAMRRGTNVHTWAECIAYGVPQYLNVNGEGGGYFPIVDQLFADLNPKLIAAEFVCIDRELHGIGYGGTSDGIFEIDGKRYMVDWKSRGADSDHGCYPEEAGQIGAYVGCQYIIMADDDPTNPHGAKREQMPKLDGGLDRVDQARQLRGVSDRPRSSARSLVGDARLVGRTPHRGHADRTEVGTTSRRATGTATSRVDRPRPAREAVRPPRRPLGRAPGRVR